MKRMINQELIKWASKVLEDSYLKLENIEVNEMLIMSDIVKLVNSDEQSYFPSLTSQGGKKVQVNQAGTGFEYVQDRPSSNSPTLIEFTSDDYDEEAGIYIKDFELQENTIYEITIPQGVVDGQYRLNSNNMFGITYPLNQIVEVFDADVGYLIVLSGIKFVKIHNILFDVSTSV